MMNWLQIKGSWRDIELKNKLYTFYLKANADGGTVWAGLTTNSGTRYAQSIVLSREDLAELGSFLQPFVEQGENDETDA